MSENTERALGRIEAKLDAALAQGADHESRIRKMEMTWAGITAILALPWLGLLAAVRYFRKSA